MCREQALVWCRRQEDYSEEVKREMQQVVTADGYFSLVQAICSSLPMEEQTLDTARTIILLFILDTFQALLKWAEK